MPSEMPDFGSITCKPKSAGSFTLSLAVIARNAGALNAMQIRIKHAVESVPGGMMIVPLVVGSAITTLAPRTAVFFGSFTSALFTGALPILAVFYAVSYTHLTLPTIYSV